MNEQPAPNRCRVVLVAPPPGAADDAARLEAALSGGDVAALILAEWEQDEAAFQARAEALTPLAQKHGAAAMIAGPARIAARVGADGIHVEGGKDALAATVDKYAGRMMIGAGGIKSRDDALQRGETQPDYVFFGRFGYDARPQPHPRNLALAAWWSQMVRIPCIVLGGCTVESAAETAAAGADFVALSAAIFAADADPAQTVARVNAVLDAKAPLLEEASP